jgi:membrane fusion protein (multidrug efflux system)
MRHRTTIVLGIGVALVAAGLFWRRAAPGAGSDAGQTETPTVVAVHVAPVVRATLRGYVTAWGRVEPEPATRTRPPASARIAALVPGLVAEVACAEGQRVAKGAVLFQLDPRVADVAVQQGRQAVAYAEQVFERQKKLGPGEATSQRLYQEAEQNLAMARDQLRSAEAQRALLTITTPLAGTVVSVSAKPGDTVDLTTVLAEVVDLDRLVVGAEVRSADVPRLKSGQPAEMWTEREAVGAPSAGAPTYAGAVVFIGQQVDPGTDTVRVRLSVPRGSPLRPGQFVNLRVVAEVHEDRLAVPVASIVTHEGVSEIAIVTGEQAAKRPVTVGLRDGNLVEVEGDGLAEGMTVVTEGAYGLPEQSRIRVIGR